MMFFGDVITDAALNLECRGFQPPSSDNLVYALPYVWAFALCYVGKRQAWMAWFTSAMARMGLRISEIADGSGGEIVFTTVPIEEAQSN